jgi:CSLREA domain-containing protein
MITKTSKLILYWLTLVLVVSSLVFIQSNSTKTEAGEKLSSTSERIMVHSAGRSNPWIKFSDGRDLPSLHIGSTALKLALEQRQASPLSLASEDFDEDGVPDLITGYAAPSGGILTLRRGNVDSILPHSYEARKRKANGTFTDSPFLSTATVFGLPQGPNLLGTGDFDADGHMDLVAATLGGNLLYLLSGDGRGGLSSARPISLPGQVTALVAGEINRPDGLADLVVGIAGSDGPKALVFEGPEGALRARPEAFALPSQATSLALAQLEGDYCLDLAVAAGNQLMILQGRDRKLSLDEVRRAEVPKAKIYRQSFQFPIMSVAAGDFRADNRRELAVLSQDGRVQLLERDGDKAGKGKSKWRESSSVGISVTGRVLISARVSSRQKDNLIVVDPISSQLQILIDDKVSTATSLDIEEELVAVLPMRLNGDALTDLVILRGGKEGGLAAITTAAALTFIVNSTGDGADEIPGDGTCSDNLGNCTLRAAIEAANENPGTDTITFSIGSGVQTIMPFTPLPQITDPVIIDGTTQPGFTTGPLIGLNGTNATSGGLESADGLAITAGNSTVRGLVINFFLGNGIKLAVGGGNVVEGNYIGTTVSATPEPGVFPGNLVGISISDSPNNMIGGTTDSSRNIISNSNGRGIEIFGGTSMGNKVQGNFIGTDVTGTIRLINETEGIFIDGAPNTTIGGTATGARNIISGNGGTFCISGIVIKNSSGNLVQGNLIGTDKTGAIITSNIYDGVRIDAASSNTIGGTTAEARNVISGNRIGVEIFGATSTGNLVQGNFIGTNATGTDITTDSTGTIKLGNNTGVKINNAPNNTIGGATAGARNIISGNDSVFEGVINPCPGGRSGVEIFGSGSTENQVQGNFIGTDVTGTIKLGNGRGVTPGAGVEIIGAHNNTIGGTTVGTRNVISGNKLGISISNAGIPTATDPPTGNLVQGNFIGTDVTGTIDLGNELDGVSLGGNLNTIGGTTAGARNIISGNDVAGINLASGTGNLAQGNFIGTDVTGTVALGNGQGEVFKDGRAHAGVSITGDAVSNTIGGTSAEARNIISGNKGTGIFTDATGNFVQGNFIGTDVSGNNNLGNMFDGLFLVFGSNNTIGGTGSGAGNKIAFNNRNGLFLPSFFIVFGPAGTGNAILSNSIFSNASLGIDLSPISSVNGINPNDLGDTDAGANNLQNYPVLTSAASSGSGTTINGTLNSKANTLFTLQFFSNTICNGSGNGEGESFLGSTTVTTDGSGNASFTAIVSGTATPGQSVTATATDPSNNTSEFSACIPVGSPPSPPAITEFLPMSGPVGTSVTITGSSFTGTTAVAFNGVSAAFSNVSNSSITAIVPAGATTGKISVTTPAGTALSLTDFTINAGISSFSPSSGPVGTSVTITGSGFTGATTVTFNTIRATIFKVVSNSTITATVPTGATTGPIKVTTPSGTLTSATNFKVSPKVNSFTPTSGKVETAVTISGLNFIGTTAVSFNGVNATTFSIISATSVKANVPLGAKTGPVSVTTPDGSGSSATNFTVLSGISGFAPASGPVGTTVTVRGSGFTGATAVKFGTANASFTVDTDSIITTVVPAGAITGKISVTVPTTTFTSVANFAVSPKIDSFMPGSGSAGTAVTISGSNFSGATSVKFGGVSGSFTTLSATSIRAIVPITAITGPITVTTSSGTATSTNPFTVLPKITSFTPTSGKIGTSVAISGSGFTGTTSVSFGSVRASSFTVVSSTSIRATVPLEATTGKITVTTPAGDAPSATNFTVLPGISSFSPASGPVGTVVTILGSGFTGTTAVKFNTATATTIDVISDSQVTATVPVNATTGKIGVVRPTGTVTSLTNFNVMPTVSGFSPTSGPIGTVVTITGSNLTGATSVKFNGASAVPTLLSPTSIRATVPTGASSGPISVTTAGGTGVSTDPFMVLPKITSFTPTSGKIGVLVSIAGTGLGGATAVSFNGVNATSFTVVSATSIRATVPLGATTGPISVTTPAGTDSSADNTTANFRVLPGISSFSPSSGPAGTEVTIFGSGFAGATAVRFGTMTAGFTPDPDMPDSKIRAIVPSGAITGLISVVTPIGTFTSPTSFAVKPKIDSFTPTEGASGTTVTITGTGFSGTTSVKFNNVAASFRVVSATSITATVPAAATTGAISVTTAAGTSTSEGNFTVLPKITSFTPTSGKIGVLVSITGTGLGGATAVSFNAVNATSFTVVSATSIRATVPLGATTGPISVTTPSGTGTSTAAFTLLP